MPIGVNGFALPLPSHTSTRSIGNKINHNSRLWMTSSDSSDELDNNSDDVDADLPELKNKLTREFVSIGFPAFIQLAAEPLAALVVCHSFVIVRLVKNACPRSECSPLSIRPILAIFLNFRHNIGYCLPRSTGA